MNATPPGSFAENDILLRCIFFPIECNSLLQTGHHSFGHTGNIFTTTMRFLLGLNNRVYYECSVNVLCSLQRDAGRTRHNKWSIGISTFTQNTLLTS